MMRTLQVIVLWLITAYVGICAAIVLTMLVALAVEQMRLRLSQLRHREVVGLLLADPVEAAYSDAVGMVLDVEPAPATDELPPVAEADVNGLLVEIYRHQIRAHFKSIYGEDQP
jgi:hypothetical protein